MSISRRRVVAVVAVLIALAVLIWLVAFREEAPPTPDTGSVPSETVPGNNDSAGADPVDETAAMPPVAGAIPPVPEIARPGTADRAVATVPRTGATSAAPQSGASAVTPDAAGVALPPPTAPAAVSGPSAAGLRSGESHSEERSPAPGTGSLPPETAPDNNDPAGADPVDETAAMPPVAGAIPPVPEIARPGTADRAVAVTVPRTDATSAAPQSGASAVTPDAAGVALLPPTAPAAVSGPSAAGLRSGESHSEERSPAPGTGSLPPETAPDNNDSAGADRVDETAAMPPVAGAIPPVPEIARPGTADRAVATVPRTGATSAAPQSGASAVTPDAAGVALSPPTAPAAVSGPSAAGLRSGESHSEKRSPAPGTGSLPPETAPDNNDSAGADRVDETAAMPPVAGAIPPVPEIARPGTADRAVATVPRTGATSAAPQSGASAVTPDAAGVALSPPTAPAAVSGPSAAGLRSGESHSEERSPAPGTGSLPPETAPDNNDSAGADPVDETAAMPPVAGAIPPVPEIARPGTADRAVATVPRTGATSAAPQSGASAVTPDAAGVALSPPTAPAAVSGPSAAGLRSGESHSEERSPAPGTGSLPPETAPDNNDSAGADPVDETAAMPPVAGAIPPVPEIARPGTADRAVATVPRTGATSAAPQSGASAVTPDAAGVALSPPTAPAAVSGPSAAGLRSGESHSEERSPAPGTGSLPPETAPDNNDSAGADPVDETAAMPPVAGAIPPVPEIARPGTADRAVAVTVPRTGATSAAPQSGASAVTPDAAGVALSPPTAPAAVSGPSAAGLRSGESHSEKRSPAPGTGSLPPETAPDNNDSAGADPVDETAAMPPVAGAIPPVPEIARPGTADRAVAVTVPRTDATSAAPQSGASAVTPDAAGVALLPPTAPAAVSGPSAAGLRSGESHSEERSPAPGTGSLPPETAPDNNDSAGADPVDETAAMPPVAGAIPPVPEIARPGTADRVVAVTVPRTGATSAAPPSGASVVTPDAAGVALLPPTAPAAVSRPSATRPGSGESPAVVAATGSDTGVSGSVGEVSIPAPDEITRPTAAADADAVGGDGSAGSLLVTPSLSGPADRGTGIGGDGSDAVAKGARRASPGSAEVVADGRTPESGKPALSQEPSSTDQESGPAINVVRVDPEGNAVIAGNATPNVTVEIRDGDRTAGTATSNGAGDWVIITEEPLQPGKHVLSAIVPGRDGTESPEGDVVVAVVPERDKDALGRGPADGAAVDRTPLVVIVPRDAESGMTSRVVQAPESSATTTIPKKLALSEVTDDAGAAKAVRAYPEPAGNVEGNMSLDVIDYGENYDAVFSGRAEPGQTLEVFVDDKSRGKVEAGSDGQWALQSTLPEMAESHRLRIEQRNPSGVTTARLELPFIRAQPFTELPEGTTIIVQPGNSLWRISRRIFGRGIRYLEIYLANADQIREPDLIFPGQIFGLAPAN